ncbi:MAG: aminoglycoside phosphotransferase family protein [Gammaproteobacteria bacterium]|nr:aminoglycoside phosphotransferase family protein [Gammaproteobacteria bacterium]
MTFKDDWEKTNCPINLSDETIFSMIAQAYPDKRIQTHQIIAGGCANINVRVQLEQDDNPILLRIYLRDKEAAYREQNIAHLIHKEIPIPRILYIGLVNGYRFAIAEWMPGITLRELLLSDQPYDMHDVMYRVGKLLAKFKHYPFPKAGFFDSDFNITPSINDECVHFVERCLQDKNVATVLSKKIRDAIAKHLGQYKHLLPDPKEAHLVHGDFDPANVLVMQHEDHWQVSAVLDWEFAFSGSMLWDVANMLRYAHQLPETYQQSFLTGLQNEGVTLPEKWQITVHLLNLFSMLDLLSRKTLSESPRQCVDIKNLIEHIVSSLDEACLRKRSFSKA